MGFAITSVLPWGLLRCAEPQVVELAKWERLRQAARSTLYYADHSGEFPVVELGYFYRNHRLFLNPAAPPPSPVPLDVIWDPLPSVIALKPWFPLETRILQDPVCEQLHELAPQALAAPIDVLRGVARAALERRLSLPSLTHGLIALTGISRALLTQADRDWFWRVFQVPLFEQFRGFQGEVLASECECHDGLHIRTENAAWETRGAELVVTSLDNLRYPTVRLATGIRGRMDTSSCECGEASPRIKGLAALRML